MKMIAAARYAKAEKELKPVRQYGNGATGMKRIEQHYYAEDK